MNKFTYVKQLNKDQINFITVTLMQHGISGDDLENALNSRLVDIEEWVNVELVLSMK